MRVCGFVAIGLVAALGCTGVHKPLPRWIVVNDPRVEIPPDQNAATARVGDSVYLDVGRAVLDPDSKGYVVLVDGRRVAHPEWDQKVTDLRFRYRASKTGLFRLEARVPQESGEPKTYWCVVNVIE